MIEVKVTQEDLRKYATPAEEQKMVIGRLRAAGIPILGISFLVGVERGNLTIKRQPISQDLLYIWKDND